jgi:hypothetical protein
MARLTKTWSQRSESSRKRILSYYRKRGLSNRQIREGINRGSLKPYARNPVNRASPKMRQAHPDLTAELSGFSSRESLFRSARSHWETALEQEVSQAVINGDALDRSIQWMHDKKLDSLAPAILKMDADQLVTLARAQTKKDLQKLLSGQLPPEELSKLGWTARDRNSKARWHNPFWYH